MPERRACFSSMLFRPRPNGASLLRLLIGRCVEARSRCAAQRHEYGSLRVRLLAILLLALGTSTPAHAQSGDVVTDGAPLDGQSAGTDDHGSSHIFWVVPAVNVEDGE